MKVLTLSLFKVLIDFLDDISNPPDGVLDRLQCGTELLNVLHDLLSLIEVSEDIVKDEHSQRVHPVNVSVSDPRERGDIFFGLGEVKLSLR